jgi:hypothetical protein
MAGPIIGTTAMPIVTYPIWLAAWSCGIHVAHHGAAEDEARHDNRLKHAERQKHLDRGGDQMQPSVAIRKMAMAQSRTGRRP